MSTMRQQFAPSSARNLFRKQKSIDLNDKPTNDSKKVLRKQLSVDHVTLGLKHVNPAPVPINFNNLLWQNSTQSFNESTLKIVSTSAVKKRAQFAASSINTSSLSKQELLSDCLNKTMKSAGETTKTRVNINIFMSQDFHDDGFSDNDGPSHAEHNAFNNKTSSNPSANASAKIGNNSEVSSATAISRLSVSARRAQFQASRRIMSAPIRPLVADDLKNKRKARKKKVIRDKDELDDSPDDVLPEELEPRKPITQQLPPKAPVKAKQLTTRSKSVLGCDQIGIETLVSMLSSGGSDSEKEEPQQISPPATKSDNTRVRPNMLRKTVSFQDDDSFLQPTLNKDPFGNRRNSNFPFAGRIRNTRSLFGQEISNLYLPTNDAEKSPETKSENDLNSSNKPEESEAEKPKAKKHAEGNSDDKKTQDNQSPKEQECWRLYEKMKKTGLNVSYDTILRGILKPSELRLLEKQKKYLGNIEEKTVEGSESLNEPQN